MKRESKEQQAVQQPMPHDLPTEQAVLSTLMRYNEKYAEYSDILNADLFYYDREKAIYRCLEGVLEAGGITDINSMCSYADTHDVGYDFYNLLRQDLLEIFPSSNRLTIGQDIERLRDMSRRRRCFVMLQKASQNILDMTSDFDDDVNGVIMQMGEVQNLSSGSDVSSYGDALAELEQVQRELQQDKRQFLVTGYRLFDSYFLLRPGTLTIIAAFTSVGKTALALNIAHAVARQGEPVAYYSLEMGKVELVSRGISKDMNMPASVIVNKPLSEGMQQQFQRIMNRDRNLPIYFDDRSTISFERTIRSIRTLVKTKHIKLAVIDYLQIYTQGSDDAEKETAYMARAAKNIAKETGIAVIVLSQLNRSGLHPSLKMLRGSGQIEESADNVVLIDRPDAYPDNKVKRFEGKYSDVPVEGVAKLILSKGRGVGTDSDLVAYDKEHTLFKQIEKPEGGKHVEHDEGLPF